MILKPSKMQDIIGEIRKARFLIGTNTEPTGTELFNEKELLSLQKIYNELNDKDETYDLGFGFESSYMYSINEAINASRKIQEWQTEIESLKNDKMLSPYEKYLYAYNLVTKYIYHEAEPDKKEDKHVSRYLIPILNGDRIVCVGYAAMLREICVRCGIPCICSGWEYELKFQRNNRS